MPLKSQTTNAISGRGMKGKKDKDEDIRVSLITVPAVELRFLPQRLTMKDTGVQGTIAAMWVSTTNLI